MLPYSKFHESLIRELSRRRDIFDSDLSACIRKCQEWDQNHPEWLEGILLQKSSNADHLELLIYGFVQNYLTSFHSSLTLSLEDLQEYLLLYEMFPGIHPYPPFRTYSLIEWNPQMISILGKEGISELELRYWTQQQIQEVFSTGYLPPDLARRVSRRRILKEIQNYPDKIAIEIVRALERVYGSIEQFVSTSQISIWEKCIWKIPDASTQQLSRMTSLIFPISFPRGFEELSIVWQCRLHILSQIPFWFDPTGHDLNFSEATSTVQLPSPPRINPWKRVSQVQ